MQEQLAESQENELKAIRELEQLKIETMHPEEQMVCYDKCNNIVYPWFSVMKMIWEFYSK
jgi:hypothetical protein